MILATAREHSLLIYFGIETAPFTSFTTLSKSLGPRRHLAVFIMRAYKTSFTSPDCVLLGY